MIFFNTSLCIFRECGYKLFSEALGFQSYKHEEGGILGGCQKEGHERQAQFSTSSTVQYIPPIPFSGTFHGPGPR